MSSPSGESRHVPTNGEETYGLRVLPELYKEWAATGMIANIGSTVVEASSGHLVLAANLTNERHSFPTSRGSIVHGGAIATLADEALATVAFTLANEGQSTVTADLKIDFLRPATPGRLIARGTVRHRTKRLAFCEATVEQEGGEIVAEARAVIAFVRS
ncbi:MAG TPA: PaaI family thioesterase [Candidatus Dormibacteraeota bacterium]|nr:PaaI family thioesterase [Candidatus Dormibacteraeota bacterium]